MSGDPRDLMDALDERLDARLVAHLRQRADVALETGPGAGTIAAAIARGAHPARGRVLSPQLVAFAMLAVLAAVIVAVFALVGADRGRLAVAPPPAMPGAAGANGEGLLLFASGPTLDEIDPTTGARRTVASCEGGCTRIHSPAASADGRLLAWIADVAPAADGSVGNGGSADGLGVWVLDSAAGTSRLVLPCAGAGDCLQLASVSWTSDDRLLVVWGDLFTVDATGGDRRVVAVASDLLARAGLSSPAAVPPLRDAVEAGPGRYMVLAGAEEALLLVGADARAKPVVRENVQAVSVGAAWIGYVSRITRGDLAGSLRLYVLGWDGAAVVGNPAYVQESSDAWYAGRPVIRPTWTSSGRLAWLRERAGMPGLFELVLGDDLGRPEQVVVSGVPAGDLAWRFAPDGLAAGLAWRLDAEASGIDPTYGAAGSAGRRGAGDLWSMVLFERSATLRVSSGTLRTSTGGGGSCLTTGSWSAEGERIRVELPTEVSPCEAGGLGPQAREIRRRLAHVATFRVVGRRLTLLDAAGSPLLVYERILPLAPSSEP